MLLLPIAISPVALEAQARSASPVSNYQVVVAGERPVPPMQWPRRLPNTALALDAPGDRSAVSWLISELAQLGPNWDGYGADPIAGSCIDQVRVLINLLPATIPSPEITPNPNGTLTLDWETGDQALSLELGATRFSSFWESRRGTKTDEGALGTALPEFVASALSAMFWDLNQTPSISKELMFHAEGNTRLLAA
jgi:hypothetical protein